MIATTLENNGAIVYILGRRLEVLQKAAKDNAVSCCIRVHACTVIFLISNIFILGNQKHGKIIPLQCDVTSRENLLAVVETIKKEQGYVNALFANSGVMYNGSKPPDPKDDIKAFQSKLWNAGTPEEFTKTFDVNCTAVYYTAVAFLELLHEGNKRATSLSDPTSQIIITSSIAAYRRDTGTFSISYGASKAAVTLMGKTLANVFKGWKIRVNTIAPGVYPSGQFCFNLEVISRLTSPLR